MGEGWVRVTPPRILSLSKDHLSLDGRGLA